MFERLIAALEAAIAETERIAQVARGVRLSGGRWSHSKLGKEENFWGTVADAKGTIVVYGGLGYEGWGTAAWAADHIALNDPERVLRRVARDRKLLERHKPERRRIGEEDDEGWTDRSWYVCTWCTPNQRIYIGQRDLIEWPCDDVRDLAEDYEIEVES